MRIFKPGMTARARAKFRNAAGQLANPTAARFVWRSPAGVESTYVYGTDSCVVRSAEGDYYCDRPVTSADTAGTWRVRAVGTGAVAAAEEESFVIAASTFST